MIDRTKLEPGFSIPTFSRVGTFQHWNRYAAINYEYADHHMDDDVGKHEGFEAAIGMAPLIHAYMHSMLRDWIDPDEGRVMSVMIDLRSPFLRKHTMTGHGVIKEVAQVDGETLVTLDIWTEDDTGKRLTLGTAEVAIP